MRKLEFWWDKVNGLYHNVFQFGVQSLIVNVCANIIRNRFAFDAINDHLLVGLYGFHNAGLIEK
ncbi:MAG: hypothetical protein RIR60_898 [Pseudomonadota bacterium]|jgi:hypothetical protein